MIGLEHREPAAWSDAVEQRRSGPLGDREEPVAGDARAARSLSRAPRGGRAANARIGSSSRWRGSTRRRRDRRVDHDQRLVDQPRQPDRAPRKSSGGRVAHRGRRLERGTRPLEHRTRRGSRARLVVGRAGRSRAGAPRAASPGGRARNEVRRVRLADAEIAPRPARGRSWRQQRRRQLDGEREPGEPQADRAHERPRSCRRDGTRTALRRRRSRTGAPPPSSARAGACAVPRDRAATAGERGPSARRRRRRALTAGGERARPRTAVAQAADEGGTRPERRRSQESSTRRMVRRTQPGRQRVLEAALGRITQVRGRRDRRGEVGGIGGGGEIGEPHLVDPRSMRVARDLDREPGLAAARRAGQRADDPRALEQPQHLVDLALAADPWRGRLRQPERAPPVVAGRAMTFRADSRPRIDATCATRRRGEPPDPSPAARSSTARTGAEISLGSRPGVDRRVQRRVDHRERRRSGKAREPVEALVEHRAEREEVGARILMPDRGSARGSCSRACRGARRSRSRRVPRRPERASACATCIASPRSAAPSPGRRACA